MANRWKFVELSATGIEAWSGGGAFPVAGSTLLTQTDSNGLKHFFVDHNPSTVGESNTSTVKETQTIDGEVMRISTFRAGDNKRVTKYDIKLEFQSETVYRNIKYLFNNGKKFTLYNTDNTVKTNAPFYTLMIDDLSSDSVALEGSRRIYSISIKCTDVETDASGNPIRWVFAENSRSLWSFVVKKIDESTGIGDCGASETYCSNTAGAKFFATNHAPSSAQETFAKKSQDVETINGKIVRINPIRINASGQIERTPGSRNIQVKLEYQTEEVKLNILNLYNEANEFDLYASHLMTTGDRVGLYLIADYSIDYMSIKGANRLYGINLTLREVEA